MASIDLLKATPCSYRVRQFLMHRPTWPECMYITSIYMSVSITIAYQVSQKPRASTDQICTYAATKDFADGKGFHWPKFLRLLFILLKTLAILN